MPKCSSFIDFLWIFLMCSFCIMFIVQIIIHFFWNTELILRFSRLCCLKSNIFWADWIFNGTRKCLIYHTSRCDYKNVINVFLFQNYNTLFKLQNGSSTPEKKNRSRPPSYTGGDSPIALRSRSSICDSLYLGSSLNSINRQMPPPPPPQSRKPGKNLLLPFVCPSLSSKGVRSDYCPLQPRRFLSAWPCGVFRERGKFFIMLGYPGLLASQYKKIMSRFAILCH